MFRNLPSECAPSAGIRPTPNCFSYSYPTLSECRPYLDLCICLKLYIHELFGFPPGILNTKSAELQALTDHFCFVDPSPMLTIIIILLFPTQSLHETPYQLHLYLIIYLFSKVMDGYIYSY